MIIMMLNMILARNSVVLDLEYDHIFLTFECIVVNDIFQKARYFREIIYCDKRLEYICIKVGIRENNSKAIAMKSNKLKRAENLVG